MTPDVVEALHADAAEVDRMVADLPKREWDRPTPAAGWTIRHQVAHLAFVFGFTRMAAAEPGTFTATLSQLDGPVDAVVNAAVADSPQQPVDALLSRWRTEKDAAIGALAALSPSTVVPWLVRPVPMVVLARAGMLELFGHGQDIADALGVRRRHTDRLHHVVDFAVRAWDFGYHARGLTPPATEFRFEITGPSGVVWTFGPLGSRQRVTGPAEDFCLLVTRRRHHADLKVTAAGAEAEHWLEIAQAYRGSAGAGRLPGQFTAS